MAASSEFQANINWLIRWYILPPFIVYVMTTLYTNPYDNTDDGKIRSGLKPHIDNLTKCEYLSSSNGGLTPRLDKNGNHIGCI